MTPARRKSVAGSGNARRRSDILFLRQCIDSHTQSRPFDPQSIAPHSLLPLWKFAHTVAWESHQKSQRGAKKSLARPGSTADAETSADNSSE